jgi:hypothetical protein
VIKKDEVLSQDWISHFNEETKFTPDVAVLELAPWSVFFIHDDMKEGMKSFERIKAEAVKLSPGFTQEGFCFYNHKFADDGSPLDVPVALSRITTDRIIPWADQKGAPNAHISGDLYRIRSTHVKRLDTIYENGVQFERRRVQIRINYRKRLAFKERTQIHNIAKDYLNQHVSRAEITSPILETYFVEAWMYVGVNEFWEPQIDGGLHFEPVSLVRDQKTNLIYYKYTE